MRSRETMRSAPEICFFPEEARMRMLYNFEELIGLVNSEAQIADHPEIVSRVQP